MKRTMMKRQHDRSDSPANKSSKRGRSNFEEGARSPERRRSGLDQPKFARSSYPLQQNQTSMAPKRRNESPVGSRNSHDDYSYRNARSYDRTAEYRILRVSGLNQRVNDAMMRDSLLREFKRFGGERADVDVKMSHAHDGVERVAHVYFRSAEDARDARHAKARLVLFDRTLQVEPVYPESGPADRERRGRRSTSPDSLPYLGGRTRGRGTSPAHSNSSTSSLHRRSRRSDSVDRALGGHLHHHHHHHPLSSSRDVIFRRDSSASLVVTNSGGHRGADYISTTAQLSRRHHDEKKEKFPNYLHHIPPEDDEKANRTLFIGNLDVNITEPDLRRIFERYGVVEDIDVKRPPPGQGNAYAFIKFLNLDMAHRAKVEMSGQYIGKFQCKIGYGKPIPTTRIWVGGLGPWTSLSHLEREFDRFGAIKKIDFVRGDNHAYILYDSIDAAQAACKEMRGFPLGGPDKRLRVDFADTGPYNYLQSPGRSSGVREASTDYFPHTRHGSDHGTTAPSVTPASTDLRFCATRDTDVAQWHQTAAGAKPGFPAQPPYDGYYEGEGGAAARGGNSTAEWTNSRERSQEAGNDYNSGSRQWSSSGTWRDGAPRDWSERRGGKRPRTPDGDDEKADRERRSPKRQASVSPPTQTASSRDRQWRGDADSPREKKYSSPSRKHGKDGAEDQAGKRSAAGELSSVSSLQELIKRCAASTWLGGLILKSSCFSTRMHPVAGNPGLTEILTASAAGATPPALKITQRLRLDQPKLDDVVKRLTTVGNDGHCILVAATCPPDPAAAAGSSGPVQQRPLRNLVSYLKQKEAAGVISLTRCNPPAAEQQAGVLYAFPPYDDMIWLLLLALLAEGLCWGRRRTKCPSAALSVRPVGNHCVRACVVS